MLADDRNKVVGPFCYRRSRTAPDGGGPDARKEEEEEEGGEGWEAWEFKQRQ